MVKEPQTSARILILKHAILLAKCREIKKI